MGSPGAIGKANTPSLVLFDGLCNLCSASVQFILKRDPATNFHFASLQSEAGRQVLVKLGRDPSDLHTIVLVKGEKIFFKSDAALEIARGLSGLWPLLYVFKIVPRFIRNPVYDWIARHRYRWFGKRETCWLPSEKWKNRFLDT
jgi:predicted DCC family thiol-disulfide oxidoreductase YuxK